MKLLSRLFILLFTISFFSLPAQVKNKDLLSRFERMSKENELRGLKESYKGITVAGNVQPDLFSIKSTGVSTEPVRIAATNFLESLDASQRDKTKYAVDDDEWRKWMNQHFYIRQGVGFDEMNSAQREKAFSLMQASLSASGLQLSKDIMKLNHTLGEINNNFEEYGEWLYWITIMGEPSQSKPWGWQIDGHHLIINYFVLGDQVVMSPVFIGSEPVIAETGKYKGISILQSEQNQGLAFMQSLNTEQAQQATIEIEKEGNNNLTEAFKDNENIPYQGIQASSLSDQQRNELLSLIMLYIENLPEGHAGIKMEEVVHHLDDTWFAWVGGRDDESVFYYRIYSPVVLIEFDHQRPVGTRQLYGREPHRQHVHAVIRTPNGNDYGKDLLRQHLAQHKH